MPSFMVEELKELDFGIKKEGSKIWGWSGVGIQGNREENAE